MKPEIIPGILTHTVEEYANRIEILEATEAIWAHVDIMDGQFVPNITVMPHEIMAITTKLTLEAHIMAFRPERYFSDLTVAGVQRVLIHREVYESLEECAAAVHAAADYFPEVGLVINPDTEVESYDGLPLSVVQCMSVHPGASGQPFLDAAFNQIKAVAAQNLGVVIAVDGGVSEENIKELQGVGASRFVITSHLYVSSNVPAQFVYFTQLISEGV